MAIRRRFGRHMLLFAGLAAISLGCRPPAGPELLQQAFDLGEEYKWAEAKPLVKAYLLDHPGSAAAHFLWGRCHLHNTAPYLIIAEGEFETTLRQLQEQRSADALEDRMSPEQLEGAAYREICRVYMRRAREAMQQNISPALIEAQLQRALEAANKGLAADPESAALNEMKAALEPSPAMPPKEVKPASPPVTAQQVI